VIHFLEVFNGFCISLPPSSSARGLKYEVFLSFRGSNTHKGITSKLHHQLTQRGIETYMDTNLQVGDDISPTLLKAIEESRFAIIKGMDNSLLLSVYFDG
jgi:hypothetical protein